MAGEYDTKIIVTLVGMTSTPENTKTQIGLIFEVVFEELKKQRLFFRKFFEFFVILFLC